MSNIEKLIDKMKWQPNGIRPEEAEKVLNFAGYTLVRQKGSHKQYLNKEGANNESKRLYETTIYKIGTGNE